MSNIIGHFSFGYKTTKSTQMKIKWNNEKGKTGNKRGVLQLPIIDIWLQAIKSIIIMKREMVIIFLSFNKYLTWLGK